MVRLRLARFGRKNLPHYRVVATDSRSPRDGRFIEQIGHYDPKGESGATLDLARVDYWIGTGAVPSDTVAQLIAKARKAAQPAG